MFTALIIAAALAGVLSIGEGISLIHRSESEQKVSDAIDKWVDENGYELTKEEKDALIKDYGSQATLLDFGSYSDEEDMEGLQDWLDRQIAARNSLGDEVAPIGEDELNAVIAASGSDIDAEVENLENLYNASNNQVTQLYDEMLNRSTTTYQNELDASNASYNDYVNQQLSSDAMSQAAIQGSTRNELARQQRNAITRGANAAMRLVTNINSELGLQNQAASQSLQTSNLLAQQLLNQRQAASQLRNDYTNSLNNYASNVANQRNTYTGQIANLRNGLTERKWNYGQSKAGWAQDMNDLERNNWSDAVDNYFQGDSTGGGVYRGHYGYGGRNKSRYGV